MMCGFILLSVVLICSNIRARIFRCSEKKTTEKKLVLDLLKECAINIGITGDAESTEQFGHPTESVDIRYATFACPNAVSQCYCVSAKSCDSQISKLSTTSDFDLTEEHSTKESGYATIEKSRLTNVPVNDIVHTNGLQKSSECAKKMARKPKIFSRMTKQFARLRSWFPFLNKTSVSRTQQEEARSHEKASRQHRNMERTTDLYDRLWPISSPDIRSLHFERNNQSVKGSKANRLRSFLPLYTELECKNSQYIARQMEQLDFSLEELSCSSTQISGGLIDPVYWKPLWSRDTINPEAAYQLSTCSLKDALPLCEQCWKSCSFSVNESQFSKNLSGHIYHEILHPQYSHHTRSVLVNQPLCKSVSTCSSECCSAHAAHTPPKLPARLYGESTVNMVNSLRTQHRNANNTVYSDTGGSIREKRTTNNPRHSLAHLGLIETFVRLMTKSKPSHEKCWKNVVLHDNEHKKLAHRGNVILSAQVKHTCSAPLQNLSFESITRGTRNNALVRQTVSTQKESSNSLFQQAYTNSLDNFCTFRKNYLGEHQSVLRKVWAPSLKRFHEENTMRSIYDIELIRQWATGSGELDGLQRVIRHIDSEIDITELCDEQINKHKTLHNRAELLSPLHHLYIPKQHRKTAPFYTPKRNDQNVCQYMRIDGNSKLRSPSHRVPEITHLMSPLMERSMEDEETRKICSWRL